MEAQRRGVLLGLTAYVVWGLLTVYWHELKGLDSFELIGARVMSSIVVLALILLWQRRWRSIAALRHDRRRMALTTLAGVLLAINWTSYVWAVTHGRVVETALGYFIAPLGAVLTGVVVLHERLTRSQRLALVLAAGALVVLTASYGRPPWIALMIAGSWTGYGLLKKLNHLGPLDSLAGETIALVPVAIVALAVVESGSHAISSTASGWQLVLLALSGVATVVPLLMFAAASRTVALSVLGPLQYSVPTINFLLGVTLYDEALSATRLIGFVLVWIGLAVMAIGAALDAQRSRQLTGAGARHPGSAEVVGATTTTARAGAG